MTAFVQEELEGLIATSDLRRELLGVLSDGDLAFRPHEGCLTLGELCREMGELEHTYIESFRTFRQDFSYRHDPQVSDSVAALAAWYARMEDELQHVLEALSEEDLSRSVDRGHGFAPPATVQVHIYHEALLIFYAKAHVYLKALGKRVPGHWQWWIGDRADYESVNE